jgi:hypothetical protein
VLSLSRTPRRFAESNSKPTTASSPTTQAVEAGVIARERRGRYSYYALVDGVLDDIAAPERAAA